MAASGELSLQFLASKGYTFFGERTQWAKAHFFVRLQVGFAWAQTCYRWTLRLPTPMVDLGLIREMAERIAKSEGLKVVDVELKGGRSNALLRVYIDKPGGVSHADCTLVSEQLSAILDVEDPIPGRYTLEVSSPGLDRKLTKPSDFAYFVGRRARLVLKEPVAEQKVLEGRLAGFENGRVRLDLGDLGLRDLDFDNIRKAQLVVEL